MKALGINGRKIEGRHILGKAGVKKKIQMRKKAKIYFKIQEEI